jgi:hypothetical protein
VTPAETLAKSKQLDRFLGKAVTDIKASDRTAMNRFAELAAKIKANREAMEEEAVHLDVEADKTMSIFMGAIADNRSMLSDAREGAQAMREAALGMAGHNGAPLEVSPPAVPPSPPVTLPPVVEVLPNAASSSDVPVLNAANYAAQTAPPPVPLDPTATGNPPA